MTQIAKMYGGSLYDLAAEEHIEADVLQQLADVSALLVENPEYQHLLCLPNIPKKERCGLLDEAFGGKIQPYLLNFMKILCENGTFAQLHGCAEEYRNRYNEANGIVAATVTSALALSAAECQALCQALEAKTGKKIELTAVVDPACLGGLRVDLAGTELDGTVKGRLAKMQKGLDGIQL